MNRSQTVLVAVVAVLVGILIGGAAAYLYQEKRITELEERMADLYEQRSSLEETESPEAEPEATEEQPPTEDAEKTSDIAPKAERQYSFVREVTSGSKPSMVADYAQFLTGPAAAAAAAAAGGESPPPNDYYVVNENPRLRTLKVKPGISVKLTSNPDGTVDPAGYNVAFDIWAGYFAAPSDENAGIRGAGYWLTLDGDTVVAIEEQFVP